jgi:hypothetical protein
MPLANNALPAIHPARDLLFVFSSIVVTARLYLFSEVSTEQAQSTGVTGLLGIDFKKDARKLLRSFFQFGVTEWKYTCEVYVAGF